MSGLLIGGFLHQVPGVTVIGPHEAKWAHLGVGDYRVRHGLPTMMMLHTTKGDAPQHVVDTIGPSGRAERTATMWGDDPTYSGANGVTGSDGIAACLLDLVAGEAFHATVSNRYAVGWEVYQEAGGVIHRIAITNTVAICNVVADVLELPRQFHGVPYTGGPLKRFADGGRGCYGFFGHRDNTDRRGRGDPGDAMFAALQAAGWEPLDFEHHQDLDVGARRQKKLNAMGASLAVDGYFGPSSVREMRRRGFANGRELDAAVEAAPVVA